MANCLYPAFIGAGDACERLGLCKKSSIQSVKSDSKAEVTKHNALEESSHPSDEVDCPRAINILCPHVEWRMVIGLVTLSEQLPCPLLLSQLQISNGVHAPGHGWAPGV